MRILAALTLATLLLCAVVAGQQREPNFPKGQREEDRPQAPVTEQAERTTQVSPAQIKADADQLATLAKDIPADIAKLNRGLLNKDLDKKLQKIEKLAKKLRREISS